MKRSTLLLYSLLLLTNLAAGLASAQSFKISFTGNSIYSPFLFSGDEKDKKTDSFFYKSSIVLEASLRVQSVQDPSWQVFTQLIMTPRMLLVNDEGASRDPDIAEAFRLLSKPVYIQRNDSGRVVQVYFDTAVTSTYRQLWNQLIAYMQCMAPATRQQQPAVAWESTEEDRIGFFTARYEPLKADGQTKSRRFRKRGTGYTAFASQGMADYVQQLEADYVLNNDQLSAVSLHELLQLRVKGKNKATTTSTFRLSIDTVAAAPGAETASALVQQLRSQVPVAAAVTLSNFVTRREIRLTMYRQTLGGQTFSDVLQAIDTLTVAEATIDKDRINRKVAALVYLYPALSDSFMQRIVQDTLLSPAFRVIVKGFIHAATPLAQQKTGILLQQHQHSAAAIDFFTNALLFIEEPEAGFIASVQSIAYNRQAFDAPVQEALRYLLGSFSHSLQKNDPALSAATILNTLAVIKKDSRKPEKEKTLELLGVAGNAGNNHTFAEVSSYVVSKDTDIRLQALFSLRLIDTAAVDTLLLHELADDTNAVSKMTILSVLRYRPITPRVMNAVIAMLSTARDESLAINGVRLLYENKNAFPGVLPLLKKMGGQTTNNNLKKEINTLLSSQ